MKPNKLTLALLTSTLIASFGISAHAGNVSRTDNGRGVNQWTDSSNFKSTKTRTRVQDELRQAQNQGMTWVTEYQDPPQATANDGHTTRAQTRTEHSAATATGVRNPGDLYYGA